MIGFLRGQVEQHTEGKLLVLVPMGAPGPQGPPGVGYLVNVPQGQGYALFTPGKWVELSIYTHVREDALDLYGFLTPEEKELFLTLLSVNGIGPKLAMAVLSGGEVSQILQAILDGDKAFLTEIPGVGKKIVERIVLELADPIRKKIEARVLRMGAVVRSAGQVASQVGAFTDQVMRDARDALLGLGYREVDVASILQKTLETMPEKPKKAEELIRAALKRLN